MLHKLYIIQKMSLLEKYRLVKEDLMKSAMCSDFEELKKIYFENNGELGNFKEWMLIGDLFMYSCETMNIELLDTLYEIYEKINVTIGLDNNPQMFHKSIQYQNIEFYNHLLSHKGPFDVFNRNKELLIKYTINNRFYFTPILESLHNDEINYYIQMITEDAIISYDENKMRVHDNTYVNENYLYMVYETEDENKKDITYIPISVKDNQYIIFLKSLIK